MKRPERLRSLVLLVGLGGGGLTIGVFAACAVLLNKGAGEAPTKSEPPMESRLSSERLSQVDQLSDRFARIMMVGETLTTPVFWNAWTTLATDPPTQTPVTTLAPDATYTLHIDLAALRYDLLRPGLVQTTAPSKEVLDALDPHAQPVARFDILVIPDPELFVRDGDSPWEKELQVQLSRLARYRPGPPIDPFEAAEAMPSYRFGQVRFDLHTRPGITAPKAGWIAVSIWANGRPIEELALWRCISRDEQDCAAPDMPGQPAVAALVGATQLRTEPDAALHLVEVGNERVWAIFRRRGESLANAAKWQLQTTHALRANLLTTLGAFNSAAELEPLGAAMLNVLFTPHLAGADAARARFVEFVRQIRAAPSGGPPPTLVAKMPTSLALPLGLVVVDHQALGRKLVIELPLDRPPAPRAKANQPCRLRWLAVRPAPEDGEPLVSDGTLAQARDHLDTYHDRLLDGWRRPGPDNFFDILRFGQFMNEYPGAQPRFDRAALVVLSHHGTGEGDQLFFDPSHKIPASSFARDFQDASVAILNACGTGSPAAMGFVDRLSQEGFAAIIGTATEVNWKMAVDYLHCFAGAVGSEGSPTAIGKVHRQAVECLRPDWGDQALAYMLLGDPEVPICPLSTVDGGM